jgi:hypothetical protein
MFPAPRAIVDAHVGGSDGVDDVHAALPVIVSFVAHVMTKVRRRGDAIEGQMSSTCCLHERNSKMLTV